MTWVDEMRVGLRGVVRRVWAPRGVKVRQRLQLQYTWKYLALAVDGRSGEVWWLWRDRMSGESLRPVVLGLQRVGYDAVVWDRAPGHQAAVVREVGLPLIEQPPYAPELNPAERVFEIVRGEVEGAIYDSIEAKMAAVEVVLDQFDANPARVQRLAGWDWIEAARDALPAPRQLAA